MGAEVLDFAGLEASADTTVDTNTDTTVDTGATEVETTEASSAETTEGEGTEVETTENTTEEEGKESTTEKAKVVAPEKITSDSVSKFLKGLKDADPKSAGVSRALRDSYFGNEAYKKEFSTVQAARDAKAFIDAIGGAEGWDNAQALITNINETDSLVHAGDPQIWENIVEDLKSENHLEAFPKLVGPGLSKLKEINPDGYYDVIKPHFYEGLKEVGMPKVFGALSSSVAALRQELQGAQYSDTSTFKGDSKALATLEASIKSASDWLSGMEKEDKERSENKTSPEMEKLKREREAFNKEKTERANKDKQDFRNSIATEMEKYSNQALGRALKSYIDMPFFKAFPLETKQDLARGIKDTLYSALEGDKGYQIQMKNLWGAKSPDKGKLTTYHQTKLDAIAADIVLHTIEKRYPNYAKGGSAAGKAAAAATKKNTTVTTTTTVNNKPIYVAERPKELIRETVTVAGKEYSPADLQMLQIAGKGFVKAKDGKIRLVTWRK